MKPFSILQCDNLADIQKETLDFVDRNHAEILKEKSLWHKINTKEYITNCKQLTKWTNSLKLKIREVSFTVVLNDTKVDIHVDEPPTMAKINVPILNTERTFNQWFDIPKSDYKKHRQINQFGEYYYNFKNYDLKNAKLIGEVELLRPIVFNSALPHNVKLTEQSKFPRLVLSVMLFKDPINFLN